MAELTFSGFFFPYKISMKKPWNGMLMSRVVAGYCKENNGNVVVHATRAQKSMTFFIRILVYHNTINDHNRRYKRVSVYSSSSSCFIQLSEDEQKHIKLYTPFYNIKYQSRQDIIASNFCIEETILHGFDIYHTETNSYTTSYEFRGGGVFI